MSTRPSSTTEYRNYYLPPSFPVLLLSGSHWRISDVPSSRLHIHNCLEIGICHSERGTMKFYGEELPFQSGDITVVPRNVPHTTYSARGCASLWSYLMIDPENLFTGLLPSTWKNYDLLTTGFPNYRFILNKEEYPVIYQLLTMIIRELEEQKPGCHLVARGLLFSLYIEIYRIQNAEAGDYFRKADEHRQNSMLIMPALDYIEQNYMKQFTIDTLADLCHWSPTHFRRVFHETMGISPLDYLNSTRIMKACTLLCSTSESILTVSGMVGFQSVSSFNRHFMRIMQFSPREYRKLIIQTNQTSSAQPSIQYSGWMYPEAAPD